MFISGFTFVRNALKYDYPVEASIRSLLPVVDELIVCLGNSEDNTEALIRSIADPKIKIVLSVWDDSLREGGSVLAAETNKAMDAISAKADWCFYLQADEVLHEDDYPEIRKAFEKFKEQQEIEGLLFKYVHFYGSYHYYGDSRKWYRHEIRVIRNNRAIRSYRDAQGFRINDRKLKVQSINARIFHYGWVKSPQQQLAKQQSFHKLWHSDQKVQEMVKDEPFDYSNIDSLRIYPGTHPVVMKKRISAMNWDFRFDTNQQKFKWKDRILYFIEKHTGHRLFEYKNYHRI